MASVPKLKMFMVERKVYFINLTERNVYQGRKKLFKLPPLSSPSIDKFKTKSVRSMHRKLTSTQAEVEQLLNYQLPEISIHTPKRKKTVQFNN